jgi:hypothetical protein
MLQRMQHTSFVSVTYIAETSGLIKVILVSEHMTLRATNIHSVLANTSVYNKINNFSEDFIFLG